MIRRLQHRLRDQGGGTAVWALIGALVALGGAAWLAGWGSSVVRIVGVLVVLLVLYQVLKRRGAGPG
jgi:hypothetical protein